MEKFVAWVQLWWERRERLLAYGPTATRLVGTVFLAYILAGGASAVLVPMLGESSLKPALPRAGQVMMVPMVSKPNYNQVRKGIMERNLFNSEGKFPDEKERGPDGPSGVFDANAACSPTTLPLELLGTIYTGNSADSIATVKDREYTEPDIYRAGESIIGYDQAKIFKIERSRVIINNNNSKECLELSVELPPSIAAIQEAITADSGDVMPPGGQPAVESSGEINLEQGYVEKELGAGLSNILNKARLVPNVIDGGVQGFKIFAIEGGTLFDKIGLQNGDVITRVNDISLQQPEQGFALYEAFQNEKEIRIFILRDGTTPRTINVRVR